MILIFTGLGTAIAGGGALALISRCGCLMLIDGSRGDVEAAQAWPASGEIPTCLTWVKGKCHVVSPRRSLWSRFCGHGYGLDWLELMSLKGVLLN